MKTGGGFIRGAFSMRHHQRRRPARLRPSARVDRGDPALGDRAVDERGIDHARPARTSAAKRAAPGDLERSVDPRHRLADMAVLVADQRVGLAAGHPAIRRERNGLGHRALDQPLHGCLASSTMLMPRLPRELAAARRRSSACASSILNAVVARAAAASASSASAAARKLSRVAGWPRRAASAFSARHGLCATPPSASRTSLTRAVLHLERGRDRDQRERVARPVADLAIGRVAPRTAAAAARSR